MPLCKIPAKCNLRGGFSPLYDFSTFLKLSYKNTLNSQELNLKESLYFNFKQEQNNLRKLYHYALLSHAAYLNLDTENVFFNLDRKKLFKVLTNNIFQKECVKIGKFEPFVAFYLVKHFKLLAHINENHAVSKCGFRASLFQDQISKDFILAIAGSDLRPLKFDFRDVISDFLLLNGKIPKKQFNSLCEFYTLIKNKFCFDKIILVGHSLGGHLAQLFTLKFALEIENIYTFQSPGIAKKILKNIKNEAYIKEISYHFYTCDDFKKLKWLEFNFVQALHSKIGHQIYLNIGTKLHHPKLCPKALHQVLKFL